MISYELAKQLKEAGFPQVKQPTFGQGYWYGENENLEEGLYIPTLEELIEGCIGYVEFSLSKTFYPDDYLEQNWEASAGDLKAEGDTPSEALIYLWLALNKK